MTVTRTQLTSSMLLAALLGAAPFAASAVDMGIELNDDRASVAVAGNVTQSAKLEGEYLYVDGDNHLLQGALLFSHNSGPHQFEFGPMASRLWMDNSPDGTMLSLGGKYQVAIGNGLSVKASAFVSPSVLSFSGVDGHYQWSTALGYDLNPNLGFEVGYRQIHIQYDDHRDRDLEDGFYLGANFRF